MAICDIGALPGVDRGELPRRCVARAETHYVCQSCGAVHAKWAGRCDACGEWNTLAEESAPTPVPKGLRAGAAKRL